MTAQACNAPWTGGRKRTSGGKESVPPTPSLLSAAKPSSITNPLCDSACLWRKAKAERVRASKPALEEATAGQASED